MNLFSLKSSGRDFVGVEEILLRRPPDIDAQVSSLATYQFEGMQFLLAYSLAGCSLQIFSVSAECDDIALLSTHELSLAFDFASVVTIGNMPYLWGYRRSNGSLAFYTLTPSLSSTTPYIYTRAHEPAATAGLSMIGTFVNRDLVAFMGYDNETGRVALYNVQVTAHSPSGEPPLVAHHVWSASWAPGWERFAFFQFGGANFFLKTNVQRPNVNIDRIYDDLAQGTGEVASHLDNQLPDAQRHVAVAPFTSAEGEPYFATCRDDGQVVLYRIHADCRGWTKISEFALGFIPHHISVFTSSSGVCLGFH